MGRRPPPVPELPEGSDDGATEWARTTADYLHRVAEVLPSRIPGLAVVLFTDSEAPRWSVGALAWYRRSTRVKIVAIHDGPGPLVPEDGGVADRVVGLDFAVSPAEIDGRVQHLAAPVPEAN